MWREPGRRLRRDTFCINSHAPKDAAMNQLCAAAASSSSMPRVPVPWGDLLVHRAFMVRFAQRRLQDPALAEDAVHDVFEAVLSGRAAFAGRSALRSWLTAILKNKIVDLVRQRAGVDGERNAASLEWHGEHGEHSDEAGPFDCASPQPQPDEIAEQRQRLACTLERIEALPAALREAITLRVLHDQPSSVVCKTLDITENNLFQRLFRARRQLAVPIGAILH